MWRYKGHFLLKKSINFSTGNGMNILVQLTDSRGDAAGTVEEKRNTHVVQHTVHFAILQVSRVVEGRGKNEGKQEIRPVFTINSPLENY